jgi:hypothetical protein
MRIVGCNGAVTGGLARDGKAAAAVEQLCGSNFVVDHFVAGESVQCVLSRAQHEARIIPATSMYNLHAWHVTWYAQAHKHV